MLPAALFLLVAVVRSEVATMASPWIHDAAATMRGLLDELERLRAENDAMRQLLQAWMSADMLTKEERTELRNRTAALGGSRFVRPEVARG